MLTCDELIDDIVRVTNMFGTRLWYNANAAVSASEPLVVVPICPPAGLTVEKSLKLAMDQLEDCVFGRMFMQEPVRSSEYSYLAIYEMDGVVKTPRGNSLGVVPEHCYVVQLVPYPDYLNERVKDMGPELLSDVRNILRQKYT